jgi:hypothetical protein
MNRSVVALAFVLGCNGGDGKSETADPTTGTDPTTTETPTTAPCTAELLGLTPTDGTVGFPIAGSVVASFSASVVEGQYTVGIDGVTGTTVLAGDGLTATFTPDAPLAESTAYQATASACDSQLASSFETAGESVDPTDLTGKTYGILFGNLTFTEPPQTVINLAESLAGLDTTFFLLVGVQDYDAANNSLIAAAATGYPYGVTIEPDCAAALGDIVADFSQNPTFQFGPTDLAVPYGAYDTLNIESLDLQGTFSTDGAEIQNVLVTGRLDLRPTGVGCSVAAALGATCAPCADGVPECLVVDASATRAGEIVGLDLAATCGL